jgi:hypothetical protein
MSAAAPPQVTTKVLKVAALSGTDKHRDKEQ